MNKITCLSNNLNKFFNEMANEVSIKTEKEEKTERFITHESYNLVNIGIKNCSIDTMCQLLNEESVIMMEQGLDFRFTKEAVEFMKRMYNESMALFKNTLQIDCRILQQLKSVKLLDNSSA